MQNSGHSVRIQRLVRRHMIVPHLTNDGVAPQCAVVALQGGAAIEIQTAVGVLGVFATVTTRAVGGSLREHMLLLPPRDADLPHLRDQSRAV